jgi:hypothetical protein
MTGSNTFIDIKLKGIDDTRDGARKGDYFHVYGVRTSDAADRLVGVAVPLSMATEIMSQAEFEGSLPTVEVPDRAWFFVASLGPAHFEKGSIPS